MIKKSLTALVTAAGSPLGQSITKALEMCNFPVKVILSDISPSAAGFFIDPPKNNFILPPVVDKRYDKKIKEAVIANKIDCIFPILEIEHEYFHRESSWFTRHNVRIVTIEKNILNRCYDKYQCMNYLASHGISVPDTILAQPGATLRKFLATHSFPLFLKPRIGASDKHTFVVTTKKQLLALISTQGKKYFILQTYLATTPEYTVGVYRSRDGSFERACVIERELKFGLSYKGTLIKNPIIAEYALSVARTLGLSYSANIQLRIHKGAPHAFEVNPRLSSTTAVRAHFGFNEPEMILLELFDSIHAYAKKLHYGSFARAWQEYYLPPTKHI